MINKKKYVCRGFMLTEKHIKKVRKMAKLHKISQNEIIRNLIDNAL